MSRSREKAYKVIDAVLFNDYCIEGFYPVFSYMPAFVNRLLNDRSSHNAELLNRWGELWRLRQREVLPLRQDELLELLYRLSGLHSAAYDWDAWGRAEKPARKLAIEVTRKASTTRELIKQGVTLLDEIYAVAAGD
jgi:hypothetical protein